MEKWLLPMRDVPSVQWRAEPPGSSITDRLTAMAPDDSSGAIFSGFDQVGKVIPTRGPLQLFLAPVPSHATDLALIVRLRGPVGVMLVQAKVAGQEVESWFVALGATFQTHVFPLPSLAQGTEVEISLVPLVGTPAAAVTLAAVRLTQNIPTAELVSPYYQDQGGRLARHFPGEGGWREALPMPGGGGYPAPWATTGQFFRPTPPDGDTP